MAKWINEACIAGASQLKACVVLGISPLTLQHWQERGQVIADSRGTSDALTVSPTTSCHCWNSNVFWRQRIHRDFHICLQIKLFRYSQTRGSMLHQNRIFIECCVKPPTRKPNDLCHYWPLARISYGVGTSPN